ncbi:S-methyl-5'-thioadenosine phosphorylase-like [Pomacea canaliculata]|uniref:S-methyl-5'-thioadenosine phosphorylase-like n=1 Tax=Pomacea canaliculata TaxID=400727 RepID=UPI000D73EBA9|nr:S-methyl-5'-thioadenosine phosphorylase-like [Pomacea canaliculata]
MAKVKIGIIGGSGLDNPSLLENRMEKLVDTPYGKPSDALIIGTISGIDCVLLARHGRKHSISPSNVNYRANIYALKQEGCSHILVTTACGSLQENIHPGEIVVIDQFIDRTKRRIETFYDGSPEAPKGICHIPMNEPFCKRTREILSTCLEDLGLSHHKYGTMITIEGPRFSSKAESKLWRSWGAHVINMSTVPEVVLAKEAGLCYASLALVTDYDSWRDDTEAVHVELAVSTFKENAVKACKVLLAAIPHIAEEDWTDTLAENKKIVASSIMLSH